MLFFDPGKPVMIVTEYMENGSLDTFLKVQTVLQSRNYFYKWLFPALTGMSKKAKAM